MKTRSLDLTGKKDKKGVFGLLSDRIKGKTALSRSLEAMYPTKLGKALQTIQNR